MRTFPFYIANFGALNQVTAPQKVRKAAMFIQLKKFKTGEEYDVHTL
jgi:hypothetical protein